MELETFFTAKTQLEVFLISCGVGLVLGLIYDIFRVFRIVVPHTNLLVAIEDVILITLYSVFTMCFAFSLMRGQIRVFFLVGNALGFTVWLLTIGSIVVKTANRIKSYIMAIFNILKLPFKQVKILILRLKKKLKKSAKNTWLITISCCIIGYMAKSIFGS